MNADELMAGIKAYVDSQVEELRGQMAAAFEQHVAAIRELQEGHNATVAFLEAMERQDNPMMSLPDHQWNEDTYRAHILTEAVRLGIKASDLAKARKAMSEEAEGGGDGGEA